jgi:perosamine synthetase
LSSGTAALHLTLEALGAKRVAVPAYACAALLTAVHQRNATAVLHDVDGEFNLDTTDAGADLAIVTHAFGKAARVEHGAGTIDDIAQSIGGGAGRHGTAAVASFYATKLMTTGEGGMVLTDDEGLAEFVRDRRDYDNRDEYLPRFNYKMTEFQAALGRVQLRRLPDFIARRRTIAAQYDQAFAGLPVARPTSENHVYFRYVIKTDARDALAEHLNRDQIEAKRPVYKSAHLYFQDGPREGVELRGAYPGADDAERRALSLPIYPSMVDGEVARVIDSVGRFFQ